MVSWRLVWIYGFVFLVLFLGVSFGIRGYTGFGSYVGGSVVKVILFFRFGQVCVGYRVCCFGFFLFLFRFFVAAVIDLLMNFSQQEQMAVRYTVIRLGRIRGWGQCFVGSCMLEKSRGQVRRQSQERGLRRRSGRSGVGFVQLVGGILGFGFVYVGSRALFLVAGFRFRLFGFDVVERFDSFFNFLFFVFLD